MVSSLKASPTMYFVLQIPALQHLVLVKIVVHLWNRREILTHAALSFHSQPALNPWERRKRWKAFEKKVATKVSALPLPEPCKKQLLNLIKPIGVQIFNWCTYHYMDEKIYRRPINDFRYLKNLIPQRLCWTMHGSVEYRQTARLILEDETVDIEQRYEVACLNCLEDEARQLIQFIPENRRQKYLSAAVYSRGLRWRSHISKFSAATVRILIVYFTCVLTGKVDQLSNSLFSRRLLQGESINNYFFEVMVINGNRATCEYWFNKLSQQEKDQVLVEFYGHGIHDSHHPNYSFIYYLSLMSEAQQERMFRECKGELLACLLRWPTQSLFMKATECWWRYMDEDNSAWVLHAIVLNICDGCKDYNYHQLFWDCWRLSSNDYKQFYIENTQYAEHALLEKQEEFLKLILNGAPSREIELFFDALSEVLMARNCAVSDSSLKKCISKAALTSSNDPQDVEKRSKSHHLSRLVDVVMKSRLERRRMERV